MLTELNIGVAVATQDAQAIHCDLLPKAPASAHQLFPIQVTLALRIEISLASLETLEAGRLRYICVISRRIA